MKFGGGIAGLLIVIGVTVVAFGILYFLGQRAEKKQAEQRQQLEAFAQTVNMLIIDKGMVRMKDSGLPQAAIDGTPKRYRRSKVPVVKAKVGPKIMTLMCDYEIYPTLPVKKEVKATVSGIYITDVRGFRANTTKEPEKKKGFFKRTMDKVREKAGAKPL